MPLGGREPQKSQGHHASLSPDFFHHSRGKKFMKYTWKAYTQHKGTIK